MSLSSFIGSINVRRVSKMKNSVKIARAVSRTGLENLNLDRTYARVIANNNSGWVSNARLQMQFGMTTQFAPVSSFKTSYVLYHGI